MTVDAEVQELRDRVIGQFWRRRDPPAWVTVLGVWGDMLAACGNARAVLAHTGGEQVGVVYAGWTRTDPGIAEFLACQPWVREVRSVPATAARFALVEQASSKNEWAWRREWFPELLADLAGAAGVAPHDLAPCHVDATICLRPSLPLRWTGAALPARARELAADLVARERDRSPSGRVFLLHPYSLTHGGFARHWPGWRDLVAALLSETGHRYLLTGYGWDPRLFGAHPRLVNLVGETGTMTSVLALAEAADGQIVTTNGLTLWGAVQGIPTLVLPNRGCRPDAWDQPGQWNYFRSWFSVPPVRLLPWATEPEAALGAFLETFAEEG